MIGLLVVVGGCLEFGLVFDYGGLLVGLFVYKLGLLLVFWLDCCVVLSLACLFLIFLCLGWLGVVRLRWIFGLVLNLVCCLLAIYLLVLLFCLDCLDLLFVLVIVL